MPETPAQPFRPFPLVEGAEHAPDLGHIVRMRVIDQRAAHQVGPGIAGNRFAGGRQEGDVPAQVGGDDDVGGVLGHQPVAGFRLPLGRKVLDLGDEVVRFALGGQDHRRRQADPDHPAVLAEVAFVHPVARDLPRQQPGQLREIQLQVIGVGYGLEVESQRLVDRIADDVAENLVQLQQPPVQPDHRHADRRVMEGVLEQFDLGAPFRDVVHQGGELPAVSR